MQIKTFKGNGIGKLTKIDIEDIAHALSNQCLFFGHTKTYISYAEFSVRLAEKIDISNLRNYALLYNSWRAFEFTYSNQNDLIQSQNRIIRELGLNISYNNIIGKEIMKPQNELMMYVYNHYIAGKEHEEEEEIIDFGLPPNDSKLLFINNYEKYL